MKASIVTLSIFKPVSNTTTTIIQTCYINYLTTVIDTRKNNNIVTKHEQCYNIARETVKTNAEVKIYAALTP